MDDDKEDSYDVLNFWSLETVQKKNKGATEGLTSLTQLCLGKPVLKDEQVSNWKLRPLRLTQIEYAALDAYCEIGCYEYLLTQLKLIIPSDVTSIIQNLLINSKNSITIKKSQINKSKENQKGGNSGSNSNSNGPSVDSSCSSSMSISTSTSTSQNPSDNYYYW